MPVEPNASGATLSPFARTADVIEEVAEWAGVHPAATLMGMRGVSRVWRGAVSSALRRMAAHEDEGWATASRVSAYVAAKPVVVRLCIVAGGAEWLRELPDTAVVPTTGHKLLAPMQLRPPSDTVSSSVAFAIDVLRRVPLLERMPIVTLQCPVDAAALCSALSERCPRLRNLSLRLTGPGVVTEPVLASLPSGIESLEVLPTPNAKASTMPPLDVLVPRLAPTLRDVSLAWGESAGAAFRLVERHCGSRLQRCRMLGYGLTPALPTAACAGLEELTLKEADDGTARGIATHCPRLLRFSVASATMTATGLLSIADGCKRLSALRLHQEFRFVSTVTSWDFWTDFACRCPTLRVFVVDHIEGVAGDSDALENFARALPALETLSLARTASAVGSRALCCLAAHAPALRCLVLGYCSVTDEVCRALACGCPDLRDLETTDACVTDEGLEALARGCPELRVLGLSLNTGYRVPGAPEVPATTFSDRGVAAIARGCKALAELRLDGRASLTDATLHALWAHARRLHRLSIPRQFSGAGSAMTAAGLELMAAAGVHVIHGPMPTQSLPQPMT